MKRRLALVLLGGSAALVLGIPAAWSAYSALRFPSDQSPEGAYLRIVIAFGKGQIEDSLPYLEEDAKNAVHTIHEYRGKSLALIRRSFPEPERSQWESKFAEEGDAANPPSAWAVLARRHGWDNRMRRDLSGIASVERVGNRATVQTTRGTRYPFRQADNGIWGLTLFTAQLVAHKQKAVRDYEIIFRAAQDYDRVDGGP